MGVTYNMPGRPPWGPGPLPAAADCGIILHGETKETKETMTTGYTVRPVPCGRGPWGRRPLPAPPPDPRDYWATRKWVSSGMASLSGRIDQIEARGVSDEMFLGIARRVGVAFASDVPTLAGRSFRLDDNGDVYAAVAAVVAALGGTVEE